MHQLNRLHDRKPPDPTHSKQSLLTRPHTQNLYEALSGSYFLSGNTQEPIDQEAGMVEI